MQRLLLQGICENYYLQDIWRTRNPDTKRYSWYRLKPKLTGSRLDYALVSIGLTSAIENTFYFNGLETDHSAFYFAMNLSKTERGNGYWKFNVSLLQDRHFLTEMSADIERVAFEYKNLEPKTKWELIKKSIIKFSQNYSKANTSERQIACSQLAEKISHMEDELFH